MVNVYIRENKDMNSKTKKTKKPSLSKLRKIADKLWSVKVKEIQGYKCAVTGLSNDEEILNSHHIEARSNLALRWDVINGICLSCGTHTFRKDSAHKSTVWFYEWLLENRPGVINHIRKHRQDEVKITVNYLNEIIEKLSQPPTQEELLIVSKPLDLVHP